MAGEIGVIIKGNSAQLTAELQKAGAAVKSFGTDASASFAKGEISAKQLAFATRGLPAQFTDIVVSLQAGQAPLTVLLQQGGQIKDMFGGIGPAAKAMGGYVLALVNPYVLAAGAVTALGVAYYQGAQESHAFAKAIVLSGNAAGVTVTQLQAMAASIHQTSGISTGVAAAALAEFVSNGNIASSQFEKFAKVAIDLEKLTGIAVADTVKQFSELGKDPVGASLKLNESTHFLTLSVYDQIKALTEQGRVLEAGALAQDTQANVTQQRLAELKGGLGNVEIAWGGVKSAAKWAWDAMQNMGRDGDPVEKLKTKLAALKAASTSIYAGGFTDNTAAQIKEVEAKLAYYDHINASERDRTAWLAAQTKQLDAQVALDKEHDKYLSKELQMQREIATAIALSKAAPQSSANTIKLGETIEGIEKKFKETAAKTTIKPDAWLTDVAKSYTKAMDDLGKAQEAAAAKANELSGAQSILAKTLAAPEFAAYSRQQQEQIIMAGYLVQKEEDHATSVERTKKSIADTAKELDAYATAQQKSVQSSYNEVAAAQAAYDAHNKLKSVIAEEELARLQNARAIIAGYEDTSVIDQQIASKKRLIEILKSGEVRDAAEKGAKAAADAWNKTADSINNALTDALMRGFENGKSAFDNLWESIKNTLKTSVLRVLIQPVTGAITGMMGMSGSANAASSGNMLGSASALNSSMGWLTNFGGSVTNWLDQGMSSFGGVADIGGMSTQSIGQMAQTFGEVLGYANAAYALSQGKYAEAAGSAIGTYFGGPIGAFIGSNIGKAVDKFFGGETRSGGQYKSDGSGAAMFVAGPSGGQIAGDDARRMMETAQASISNMLKAVGSTATLTGFQAGLESSDNNRGGVMAGGTLSTGATFGQTGRGSVYDGTLFDPSKSFNMDAKTAFEQYGVELGQSIVEALLVTSDIPLTVTKIIGAALGGKSVSALTGEATTALLTSINTVTTAVTSFNTAAKTLPFANLKQLSFDAAAGLIAFAGSMDALGANLTTYYQAFYSSEEQRAQLIKNINATLVGSSFDAATATREQYRALVEAQDVTTESGQKMYAALISVAGAFDQVSKSAGGTIAALQASAYASYQAAQKAVDPLRAFALSVRELQISLWTGAQSPAKGKAITSMTAARFATVNVLAAGGDKTAQGNLSGAATGYLDAALNSAKNATEYARAFAYVQNSLNATALVTEASVSVADAQLAELKQSNAWLASLDAKNTIQNDSLAFLLAAATASSAAAQAAVQEQAAQVAQAAIEQARISAAAVAAQAAAAAAAAAAKVTSDALGAVAAAASVLAVVNFPALIARMWIKTAPDDGYWSDEAPQPAHEGGGFAIGTNYVPYDMRAQIHQGERIIPAADNRTLMARLADPQANSSALLSELRALRQEVASLRIEARATASNTNAMNKTLSRVTPDGNSIQMVVAS